MPYLTMSVYINKETLCSPNSQGPPTLNYPTFIQQKDSSTYCSRGIPSHIPNWHRVRASVFKYAAVIQATRSTPSGTQLTQYPSSRETIRQRNFRSVGRLPHFIGRCSTRARAGLLARRYPRWTLRKVPRNLPRLVRFESPHTPRQLSGHRQTRHTDRKDQTTSR